MFWDPRQLRFGKRALSINESIKRATLDDYTDARYQMGLVEGADEIEFGKAFPLEHNLGLFSCITHLLCTVACKSKKIKVNQESQFIVKFQYSGYWF